MGLSYISVSMRTPELRLKDFDFFRVIYMKKFMENKDAEFIKGIYK